MEFSLHHMGKNSVTVSAQYEDWEDAEGLGPQRWCHLKGI